MLVDHNKRFGENDAPVSDLLLLLNLRGLELKRRMEYIENQAPPTPLVQ